MSKNLLYSIIGVILLSISSCGYALTVTLKDGKQIKLMDMNLSKSKIDQMTSQRISFGKSFEAISADIKPVKNDVGMSNVPVLDQGQYGTCVTFASTAALDARYALGNLISQQCILQLNVTLGNDLWDGAYRPDEVIEPLKKYGVVSQLGCNAGYPARSTKISVDEYKRRVDKSASEQVSGVRYSYYSSNSLSALKSSVLAGKRVLIAFLLNPNSKDGVKGYDVTINGSKKYGGLWACSAPGSNDPADDRSDDYKQCMEVFPDYKWYCDWLFPQNKVEVAKGENCGQFQAGHEVIATGFDDEQKVIKIRNSWGYSVGDSGEYYMSYEFFESQVVDMTVIN